MQTEQKKIVPIVVFSDGETWESIPDLNDPGLGGATIRFISMPEYNALCQGDIAADTCVSQRPDIPLSGFDIEMAIKAQECLVEAEFGHEFEDSVYIRIPQHLWTDWRKCF